MRREEQALHLSVAQFLDVALPADALWFHYPSGMKRTKAEAGLLKAMGTRAGMPDIWVLRDRYRLYTFELKTDKGVLSDDQKDMHKELRQRGITVDVCRSPEEVEAALRQYMPLKATLHSHPQPAHEYLEAIHEARER